MKNQLTLGIEEKFYGRRKYNLEIKSGQFIPNLEEKGLISVFDDYLGNFLVTEKSYLLRGSDCTLEKKNAELEVDLGLNKIFVLYENGHTSWVIKKFGKPKLVDSLSLIQKEKRRELCFA